MKAKDTEIQNCLKTNTVRRILRNTVPESQIIRCRWVLVWKPLDPTDIKPGEKPVKAKARLVWIHSSRRSLAIRRLLAGSL